MDGINKNHLSASNTKFINKSTKLKSMEENAKAWKEMSQNERISFIDKKVDKEITFSIKLMFDLIQNIKEMNKNKFAENIGLVEKSLSDRLLVLSKECAELANTIENK